MKRVRWLVLVFPFVLAFSISANASFRLVPMSVSLTPEGAGATQAFTVENTSNEKIAVQIQMAERIMKSDGSEEHPPADKLFNVFPAQMILEPKASRTVRVSWLGEKNPPKELNYRLIAEQLPVGGLQAKAKGNAVINILMRYIAAIYIDPPGTEAHLEVKSVTKTREKNKSMLAVELVNDGTKHQILNEPVLVVSAKGKADTTLSGDALNALSGQNVLAGGKRRFLIPIAEKELGDDLSGALKTK
jgi:fimbrial chaperone protein